MPNYYSLAIFNPNNMMTKSLKKLKLKKQSATSLFHYSIRLTMKVQIYRIDKTLELPKFETTGSFGFDFIIRKTTTIQPKSHGLIPGNLIIKCPEKLALLIIPRSSTFKKTGLIFPHSVGLIDQDYCGKNDEIMIQVFNFGEKEVLIKRGKKIAQGLFVKTENVEFTEIDEDFLGRDSRGGFGSTG